MSVINTNVKSLVAQDAIMQNGRTMSTTMQRLSTGLRINSAADDAAGLSISTRMEAQTRGLSQAIRNANDGISLAQTSEGAIDEVTNILQRMRELSVQSANSTYNDADRKANDQEIQQLKTEIDRIAGTTQFNNINLLDGSFQNKTLQIGDKTDQIMKMSISSMKVKDLGMGANSAGQDTLISNRVDLSSSYSDGDIMINGVGLKAFTTGTDDLQDIIDGINERVDSVKASGFNVVTAKEKGTGVTTTGQMVITVRALNATTDTTFNINASNSMDELVSNINSQAGGLVKASVNDQGKLVLSNETGAKISIVDSSAAATSYSGGSGFYVTTKSYTGFLKLESSKTGVPVRVERGNMALVAPGNATDLFNIGFRETARTSAADAYSITGATLTDPTSTWAKDSLNINGVEMFDPTIASTSFQGKLDTINRFTNLSGVKASAYFEKVIDTTTTFGTGVVATDKVEINGIQIALGADVATLVTNLNAVTVKTGIVASSNGKNLILKGDNVQAVTIQTWDPTGKLAQTGTVNYLGLAAKTILNAETFNGAIRLDSVNNTPISINLSEAATALVNGASTDTHGLLETNAGASDFNVNASTITPAGTSSLTSLNNLTTDSSTKAIALIDKAIEQVNKERGNLGAIQNRLDKTVNNLTNIVTNTEASKSRILDTDYGVETTKLARAQIIQQAATAMLAQANQSAQGVLALLK
jgi:flagellin